MQKNEVQEKLHKHLQSFKVTEKCPVCGEECISWYRKGIYSKFWKEKECPNCKATLKLEGDIIWITKIINLFFWLWYIFLFFKVPQLCLPILVLYIIFKYAWDFLVVGPHTKLVPYNSTPLDDLINIFKKIKTLNKKGKIMVVAGTTAVVFIFIGAFAYINNWINIKNNLGDLTYDIAQESCDNYGDYSKSKYQDIVSEDIYKSMNYLYEEDCIDKSNLEINKLYIYNFENQLLSLKTIEVDYLYDVYYQVISKDNYSVTKDGSCSVLWRLDDDNIWRISDYDKRY